MRQLKRINNIYILVLVLCKFLFRGRADKMPKSIKTILVVPVGKLGDIVCTTPVFKALRDTMPDVKIVAAGNTSLLKSLLPDSGLVDEYCDLDSKTKIQSIKKINADVAVVTGATFELVAPLYLSGIPLITAPVVKNGYSPNETRPYKILQKLIHTFPYRINEYAPRERLRSLEAVNIFSDDTKKVLGFSDTADRKAELFLKKNGIDVKKDFIVGISPSSGNKIKEWPTARFAEIADYVYKKYQAKICILGSKNDGPKVTEMIGNLNNETVVVDTSGIFNLDELKACISKLSLFISVDTGPIYIAEAFDIPTINIVGPVDERVQPPRGSMHRNVLPPKRTYAPLSILNARSYDQQEAMRQVLSTTVSLVKEEIDILMSTMGR